MSDPKQTAGDWARGVAGMAVDRLIDHGLVAKDRYAAARDVVAEELYVWLCMEHYPPRIDPATSNADDAKIFAWRRPDPPPTSHE
jgi:hypothetical protein